MSCTAAFLSGKAQIRPFSAVSCDVVKVILWLRCVAFCLCSEFWHDNWSPLCQWCWSWMSTHLTAAGFRPSGLQGSGPCIRPCSNWILCIAWMGLLTFDVIQHCFLLRYQDDFGPLLEGCTCYCCQRHTRAYVHHLLVTNELLAGVLLMMHNFQHYFSFFSAIRDALRDNKLDQLKKLVFRQVLQGPANVKPGQWVQREDRAGCRLHPYPMRVCKVDCQQGNLDLLVLKCFPSWRELKETFEDHLTSWQGRKILFKHPFWLIVLVDSWGMEEPEQLTRLVWVALFSVTYCWFSMWKDRMIELVIWRRSRAYA